MVKRAALAAAIAISIAELTAAAAPAQAQAKEIRISYQFGLGFLAEIVALEKKLFKKNAKALGLGGVTVSGKQLSGAAITNDALLSGNIDVAAGGVGGLLQLWEKSNGRIMGLVSINDMALILNTNDPSIKSVKDYVGVTNHKIALPAVKVGAHAIVLQMAAEQELGEGKQFALDKLTVSLPHPEGYAALTGGRSEVKSHFTSQPFSYLEQQSKEPPIHMVLSSYQVLGGPHNNLLLYTTETWAQENPKLAETVYRSIIEAEAWITENPKEAAKLYKDFSKSPLELSDLEAIISNKELTSYSPEPLATMKFAEFFHSIGRLNKMPSSWKDYFLPIAHELNGS